jgi:sulfonate transport system substrate-binding protein
MTIKLSRRRFCTLAASGLAGTLMGGVPYAARAQAQKDVVRFCWTNTVIVSAQLQHALMNTDIADRHGLKLEMTQFTGSSQINEALASNAADIGSVADFSAVMMAAAGIPIYTIAHQSSFRSAVLSTKKSGIKRLEDLRGKTVYGLFGITAYQNAQEAVRRVGLMPGRDVNFVNMQTAELADAVRAQKIDAFFMWDPWIANYEHQGMASVLSYETSPAMVLEARGSFIQNKPDVLKRFLRAHAEALFFASNNKALTNKWFRSRDPARGLDPEVIEKASEFDPNWRVGKFSDIRTAVSSEGIASMQRMADWGFKEKLLPKLPNVADWMRLDAAKTVDAEALANPFDPKTVRILQNA